MVIDANINQDILTNETKGEVEQSKENSIDYKTLVLPQNCLEESQEERLELLQHTFVGLVRRAANNIPTDSAIVKFVNPAGDTIWTKVGRLMTNYYEKTSNLGWINNGDTVKVIVRDTTGQTARTFRIVTPTGNYIHTLFPAGHAFLVKEVANGAPGDSVNSRCYSKGPIVWSDTLQGRFRRGYWSDDIYFNREKFQRKPALYDSIVFEIFEGSYFARTACQYKRALWDADSEPNCSLKLIGIDENLESKVEKLIIKPTIIREGQNISMDYNKIDELTIYDATGREVVSYNREMLKHIVPDFSGLNIGVYFWRVRLNKEKEVGGKIVVVE
ncbi:MAG: T9SS type A sorting domain-containing protein [Candidatus Pacearchaeota archaeon]|nr:T9SS type A sorting domain-containing protein [Candidatus Pacearchaeota archaeon]